MVKKPMKKLLSFIALALFIVAFGYYALPIFTPRIEQRAPDIIFWQTEINPAGFKALGMQFGKEDAAAAILRFGNRNEFAVFESAKGERQLELYFRETEVGPFTGRVIVTLVTTHDELMKLPLGKVKLLPDQTKRYPVLEETVPTLHAHKIQSMAFIPTAITLDEDIILKKFGQPTEILMENTRDGVVKHYLYPDKGMEVSLDTIGRSLIQYIDPKEFDQKITQPLRKLS